MSLPYMTELCVYKMRLSSEEKRQINLCGFHAVLREVIRLRKYWGDSLIGTQLYLHIILRLTSRSFLMLWSGYQRVLFLSENWGNCESQLPVLRTFKCCVLLSLHFSAGVRMNGASGEESERPTEFRKQQLHALTTWDNDAAPANLFIALVPCM